MSLRPLLLPPTTALALCTVLAGTVVPAGAVDADRAVTCQGKRATIVGTGRPIVGTPGPDVVITGGARRVETGDGADLVCVTGAAATVTLTTGAGPDRVEVAAGATPRVTARLGSGDDTYRGGAGVDRVFGDDERVDGAGRGLDRGTDRITTGAGADVVTIGGRVATRDVVDLGPDADVLVLAGTRTAPEADLRGGAGADRVTLPAGLGAAAVTVSNRGLSTPAGVRTGGMEEFTATRAPAAAEGLAVTFLGGAAGERVDLPALAGAAAAGGDDVVVLDPRSDATVRGGAGTDLLELLTPDAVEATLADGSVLTYDATEDTLRQAYDVREIERYRLGGAAVGVTGSDDADVVVAQSCFVTVDGRGGPDVLAVGAPTDGELCFTSRIALRGGEGDDVLVGGDTNDTLIGEGGTDTADGREGSDSCDAETETACELEPTLP
ncbi:hypothetical protein [Nocardioides sp.]|uniref:hypothetical protein n=1 Tax=Nocardioides sp. TaxID=35761 RepID=UPI0035138681